MLPPGKFPPDAGAIGLLEQAVEHASVSPLLRPDVYAALGRCHAALGRLDEAIPALLVAGARRRDGGRGAVALDYVRRAIGLLQASEDTLELARAHILYAQILILDDRAADAGADLEIAERLLELGHSTRDYGLLRAEQAKRAAQLGEPGEAIFERAGELSGRAVQPRTEQPTPRAASG